MSSPADAQGPEPGKSAPSHPVADPKTAKGTRKYSPSSAGSADPKAPVILNPASGVYYCASSAVDRKKATGPAMTQNEALDKGFRPEFAKPCK